MRKILLFLLAVALLQSCTSSETKTSDGTAAKTPMEAIEPAPAPLTMFEENTWASILTDARLKGSILIFDAQENVYHGTNLARASQGFLPASTFKIPNSIIALETGVIKDLQQMIKWDGEQRRMDSWEEDMTLYTAFKRSCLPCYQQLAREVGLERMQELVAKLNYPGMDIREETLDEFWVVGDSRITQIEQIDFLQRLINQELPISAQTQAYMKEMMKYESVSDFIMYAKTGWAVGENDYNLGWFVGYVTQGDKVWYFATNVEPAEGLNMDNFGKLRIEVTKTALRKMGVYTETIG